jgi:hypothetical protein
MWLLPIRPVIADGLDSLKLYMEWFDRVFWDWEWDMHVSCFFTFFFGLLRFCPYFACMCLVWRGISIQFGEDSEAAWKCNQACMALQRQCN